MRFSGIIFLVTWASIDQFRLFGTHVIGLTIFGMEMHSLAVHVMKGEALCRYLSSRLVNNR